MTVKAPELELPRVSVAVQVTTVAPLGKVDPDGGLQAGVIAPSAESFAVAVDAG